MPKPLIEPIFLPNLGIDLTKPEQFLNRAYSPYSRNMEFYLDKLQGRAGCQKFDNAQLSGPVLYIGQYWKFTGSYDLIVGTTKDIYKYDFGNSRYDYLTPKYSVGKIRVENNSTKIYGGLEVDNCDDAVVAWADGSGGDVVPSRNTTTPKDGAAFVRLTVGAGAGVELLAYHDITSVDLSAYDSIGFWIRSSVDCASGDLKFQLDNTSACATPLENINIPALVANTWTWVNLPFVTPANLTAVISIGIYQAVDKGACTIDIDQIVVGDWSDQLAVGDRISVGTTYTTADTFYEIAAVNSDTELTLTAVYAGSTESQKAYNARLIFTGTTSDLWQAVQYVDDSQGNVWIATNGVDPPVWYNGSNQVQNVSGLPGTMTTAKYINIFYNRIIWMWTREAGANQPIRVRWSAVGNFQSYNAAHVTDLELPDAQYWIKGSYLYGDNLVITKEYKAYIVAHIDDPDLVFDFQFASNFEGNFSASSLIQQGTGVYYFGYDNRFRFYNGIRDEGFMEEIFPYTLDLDPSGSEFIFGYQIEGKKQFRFVLPYITTDAVSPVVVYDYEKGIPQIWDYKLTSSQKIRVIGEYLRTSDLYVDDPAWADLYVDTVTPDFWDARTFLANSPVILYGCEDGYVRTADIGTQDDGTDYTRLFRTIRLDFRLPQMNKRLFEQEWWLEKQGTGSLTVKIRKGDATAFEAGTKTILMTSDTKDIIKKLIRWDKESDNFQMQAEATVHFALLGFLNWYFPKNRRCA